MTQAHRTQHTNQPDPSVTSSITHTQVNHIKRLKLPLAVTVSALMLAACSNTNKAPASQTTVLPGSQSAQTVPTSTATPSTPVGSLLDDETLAILEDLLEARDMSMVEGERWQVERYGNLWDRVRRGYRISQPAFNDRIENQKNWFASRQSYLDRLTARASRYLHHTVTEAERRGIPTELALLPIIESSYDPAATSNAAAAGLWQFIPSTGRIYGLNQTNTYDGRRDVIESTRAAYDFLTSLYNQFGSWELALAAYNAGPGSVQRAIDANRDQGLPTDYWSLRLPTETMNYVPRFMAVAQIIGSPAQYGVSFPAIANHSHFRTVPVSYGVSLTDVSALTNVPVSELQLLNPALTNLRVDSSGPNRIVIPNSVATNLDARLTAMTPYGTNLPTNGNDLATFAQTSSTVAPVQTTVYIRPTATNTQANTNSAKELEQAGTLPTTTAQLTSNNTIVQDPPLSQEERDFIANQIRVNAQTEVQPINPADGNISLTAVQTGQSVLDARGQTKALSFDNQTVTSDMPTANSRTDDQGMGDITTSASQIPTQSSTQTIRPMGEQSTYVVQRGDTLSGIASRAGVSMRDLAEWNQLNPNANLMAGTRLKLYGARNPASTQSSRPTQSNERLQSYVVRSGDTLTGIATANGLTVSQLASYNNLATNARVLTGQRLWLVPGKLSTGQTSNQTASQAQTTTYRVQAGETLTGIAGKLGVTTNDIAALNDFDSNARLRSGQTIKVPANAASTQSTTQAGRPSIQSGTRPTRHTVVAGENLSSIAAKYGLSTQALASANNMAVNDTLIRGRRLSIPQEDNAAASTSTSSTNTARSNNTLGGTENYTVKSGESLTSLANRYGVSVADLARTNNLAVNAGLRVGQTIKVPKVTTTHTVKSGESLGSLSRRYGISVAELAKMNNLEPTAQLRIGQKLTVPNR